MATKKKKTWQELLAEIQSETQTPSTTRTSSSGVTHGDVAAPVIAPFVTQQKFSNPAQDTTNPLSTIIAGGAPLVVEPLLVSAAFSNTGGKSTSLGKQNEKWYEGWFQKGVFDDGYQRGDIAKFILGSHADAAENFLTGAIGMGEQALDFLVAIAPYFTQGQYYANGGGYNLQADRAFEQAIATTKVGAEEFVEQDLYDEANIAQAMTSDRLYNLTGIDSETASVFAEKTDNLFQSGGQLAGTAVLQSVGVPWWVTSGAVAYGGEVENALNQGATLEEANVSGAISAGAEILTEKIAGISFGGKTIGDAAAQQIAQGISSKFLRTAISLGIDVVGEAGEEWLTEDIARFGQWLTYQDEKTLAELLWSEQAMDEKIQAAIGGGLLGGVSNVGDSVQAFTNGIDPLSGLTAQEQSVFDAALEQNLKDAEAETGKKPTGKEKTRIYGQTMEQLQKGHISTDTIGQVLGGETYTQYKAVSDQITQLQTEYDQLYNMKTGEKTDAQIDRQKELKEQLDALKQQRQTLDDQLSSLARGTQMEESYRERSRRGQAFQASATQYDNEYARQTVQNIVDSGVVNNTNRTHEFVDLLAKISAHSKLVFTTTDAKRLKDTGYAIEDATVNGYYAGNGITININSPRALNAVVGHEVTHAMKGSQMFDALSSVAVAYAKANGSYNSRLAALRQIYKGKPGYETDFDAKLQEELVADIIGDHLFTDEDFIRQLAVGDRNLFQKIFDEVKHLVKMATPGSKEARQLEKLKHTFEKVYRETKNTAQEDGVKYDISADSVIDLSKDNVLTERLSGVYGAQRYKEIQKYILEALGEQPITLSDGKQAIVDNRDALHIANKAADKKTAEISHIRDLIENAQLYAEDRNAEHNKFDYFCYYIVNVKYDQETFPIYLNVGLGKFDRKYHLYDITNRIRDTADRINGLERPGGYALTNGVSTDIIDPAFSNVNSKMSLSENAGGAVAAGRNVYGADVALDPAEQDVQVEENSNTETNLPADSMAEVDTAQLERILGSKDSFISQNASALYEELRNLKKGVRASGQLGYLLDHFSKDEWGSIKTALLNIRDNPSETVNPNSRAESIARELLGREYDDSLEELTQMQIAAKKPEEIRTAQDRYMAKLYNYETERLENTEMRQQAMEAFEQQIAELQSRYDQKTNKNTGVANQLLQQIARTKRIRDNVDADYEKRISDLSSRIVKMGTEEYRASAQRQLKHDEYYAWTEKLVGDTSTWKDKKTGWGYMTNTLRRNLRAIVKDAKGNPDYAKADAIYEELQGNYNRHEAEMNRELTKLRGKYADMKITKAEDAYIQMLGEFRHNPQTELSLEKVEEFYEANKAKIDKKKVDQIIDMARQDYDDLIKRVNAVLKEQGMKEIPYRKGYFPHFTLDKQGPLAKLLNWKTRNDDIPTDIAGLSEQFEPVRSYQHFDKKRVSDTTDYSFTKGFDQYTFGALDWVYHIEDIQKRRALEGYIRYTHSDEGVKAKIDAIKADETLDADEAQKQMDMVYEEARNPLNNFVIDLRRGTQTLAAKKSSLDREMEYSTNRRIYSTMTNISNRVSANMVAGSVSAALTNFIPITQSWGTVSPIQSMQAMAETMRSAVRDDGTIDRSAFLTNRLRKAENLNKTGWDKASDKISLLMNAVDSFTSQTVWRSKFNENMKQGMSEAEAIRDADRFAEAVLAGRSRGNMPTIFDSKNPLIKTITAFQLEVANQYGYLFQDMPQDQKNNSIGRLTVKYAEVFIGAYVYNSLFKAMTGRTAAFDPIRIIQELLQDVFAAADDDDEEDMAWSEVAGNFAENVLQEIPFVGGLLGGGRVPISSALPYDGLLDAFTGTIKDIEEGDIKNLTKEWLNPAAYALMPMAGGQLKKTIEGLGMFLGDKPVTGSYTASGDLRYEVEPTPGNILQAALFGQWANENAQEYIDQGRKPLSEKQTEEFVELDIPIQQYWDIRDHLNRIDRSDSKTKTAEKIDYISSLGLSIEQQNVLVNNLLDRKEPVDMTDYEKFGSWAEFDFYIKNPEKHAFLKDNDIPYRLYSYDKDAYNWAFENQSKYAVSKAFLVPYTQYYAYRQNINAIQSLKDSSGNTVSGSQKHLRIKYINSLPISNLEKALLIKQYYPSETGNDQFIADYLNMAYGLTASERYRILYELGLQDLWKGGS